MKKFVDEADPIDIATADIQIKNDFTGVGKKAKEKQSKQIQNREDYYKNEFAKIDSNINFLFDMILVYEKNSFDQNNTILDLDAQIIALENINENAKNTILNYEVCR